MADCYFCCEYRQFYFRREKIDWNYFFPYLLLLFSVLFCIFACVPHKLSIKTQKWEYDKDHKLWKRKTEQSTIYYFIAYLPITTCYRSWPHLICGAIHYELLQQLAAISNTQRCQILIHLFDPTLARPSLSATTTTWLRFEDFTNWVGAIDTSDMTQSSKTLYFNTLHDFDVIVYIVQLLVPSYAPFSSVAERSINLTQDFPLEDA